MGSLPRVAEEAFWGCEDGFEYFGEFEKRRFRREKREEEGGIRVGVEEEGEGLSARANDGLNAPRMPISARDGNCQVILLSHVTTQIVLTLLLSLTQPLTNTG